MRLMWLVLIFLVIGGFIIATSYNLNLKRPEDRRTFIGKFSIWLVQLGKNAVRTVGYVIKLEWLPERPQPEEAPAGEDYKTYTVDE